MNLASRNETERGTGGPSGEGQRERLCPMKEKRVVGNAHAFKEKCGHKSKDTCMRYMCL